MEPKLNDDNEEIEDLARFPSENPNPVIRANFNEILYTNHSGKKLLDIQKGSKVPELLKKYIHESISSNKIQEIEITLSDQIYSFTITPIKETGYANIYGRDISERKIAEDKLKDSEEKLRHLFETSPYAIIVTDSNGVIAETNSTTEKLFGFSKEDLVGKLSLNVLKFPTETFKILKERQELLLQGKEIEPFEIQVTLKNGSQKWILSTMSLFKIQGEISFQVIIQDITERKAAELKLKESEEKFRSIFEAIPDIYFLVSGDTTILEYRSSLKDLYIQPKSFLGKKISDVMPIDIAKRTLISTKNVLETKEPQVFEYNLVINNESRTFEARHIYLSDDRVSIFIRDITERKEAEQKVTESEEKYRNLFNTAPFGLALFNLEGVVIDINHSLTQIIGFSREDIIGKHYKVFNLYPPQEIPEFKTREVKVLKGKLPEPREISIYRKDGNSIWISSKLSFVQFGEKRYMQAIINDITQSKLAEQKLKESEEKYRDAYNNANFYKDLFAHDMNNILNSILLSTELISNSPQKPENMDKIYEIFNIIKESGNRGARLISNVQKLSSVEQSDIIFNKININPILKEAISFIKNNFQNRDINIQVETFSEEIYLNTNELLLDVFENILTNAVKYNRNDRIEVLIKISEIMTDGKVFVKLEFLDNGIGIEDSGKEKIFEVGNREYKGNRGMGFGLSLVKKIVESYGGKIMVEDKVQGDYSKGCNFIVLIPKRN